MTTKAENIIGQWNDLRGEQDNFRSLWDDIARYAYPQRIGFSSEQTPGTRRTNDLFDGTMAQAVQQLAATSVSLTIPKDEQWGRAKPADEKLGKQEDVRAWFDEANERVHKAIYDARANFRQASGELFKDIVAFGPGCMWHGESANRQHQVFKTIYLKRAVFAENADGKVDTVIVEMPLTVAQAIKRGLPVPSDKMDAFNRGKHNEKVRYLHHVAPFINGDQDGRVLPMTKFVSTMIEMSAKEVVPGGETNAEELMYHVPRWDTIAGEVYGWSPGRLALPDAGTLNQMTRTLLKGGQMAVDPAILTPSARQLNMARLMPGGPIPYNLEDAKALGRIPIQPFNTGANVPLGNDMARDRREMIWSAFLRNVLQLPVDSPQMTATEVVERRQEFLRIVEPTFGRFESEISAPVFTRAFGIELRALRLTDGNPMPKSLSNAQIEYEFSSPVQRVRERVDAAQINVILEQLAGAGQIDPKIYDNLNFDEATQAVIKAFGPAKWQNTEDQVKLIRNQRQQQQQAAAQQEQLAQIAQAAPQTAESVIGGAANAAGLAA